MTSYDVVVALLRRWWVLLIALALTFGTSAVLASGAPIYWTSYDLNLVAPDRSGAAYSRTAAPYGVTPMAGVLEILLGGNHTTAAAATQQVPIFGLEHDYGFDVRAKDKGLQWSRDYVAALTIQISGPSPEAVRAQADRLGNRAQTALRTIQDDRRIPARARLTLEEPVGVDVVEIRPSYIRAAAGALVLGICVSVLLTVAVDRRLGARAAARGQRRR